MTTFDPDTSPNPWRETVRDIYDMLHLDDDLDWPNAIIAIIEERHPRYFGIANLEPPARP